MKNRSYLFIVLLALTLGLSSCGPNNSSQAADSTKTVAAEQSIRVMTYNIHHGNPPAENGVIDLDAIAEVIRQSNADIVAVQELDSMTERGNNEFQLEILAQKLDMNFHFFRAIPLGDGAYGVGILSRFPISKAQTIKLPEHADKNVEDRVLGLVHVKLPKGKKIYFASTHWDYKHEENQLLEAEITNQVASKLEAPIIIGGDFNARTDSKPMKLLRQVFTDASKEFAPTIPTAKPNRKIDHILYTPKKAFQLKSEEVIDDELAQKASDHLPYWVDLVIVD
ncbi:endonuclease/exonuclease/phosphatase family protein [Sunxiuqinia sp. sy24]|uniref:endonuclease/exonuclease/phosphatase family protein n=1 Tax=Sunxiuqinia sp. sy24 TaxID=3461495 RepID=UPI004045CACE